MIDLGKILGIVNTIADKDGGYHSNKRRAAVVAYEGFSVSDFLAEYRSTIHLACIPLALVFAGIGWARRKHGAEACALWFSLSTLFVGVAWYTRDSEVVPVDVNGKPGASAPTGIEAFKHWLDNKADELDKTDPGWDSRTTTRVFRSV
jgi:hypothetical protein